MNMACSICNAAIPHPKYIHRSLGMHHICTACAKHRHDDVTKFVNQLATERRAELMLVAQRDTEKQQSRRAFQQTTSTLASVVAGFIILAVIAGAVLFAIDISVGSNQFRSDNAVGATADGIRRIESNLKGMVFVFVFILLLIAGLAWIQVDTVRKIERRLNERSESPSSP